MIFFSSAKHYRNTKALKFAFSFFVFVFIFVSVTVFLPCEKGRSIYAAPKISDLNEKQNQISQQLERIKKEKEALKNQATDLKGDLSWLNKKSKAEREKYKNLLEELDIAYSEMNSAIAEAFSAEENLIKKQEEYKVRLQIMFENRNINVYEMLLSSKNISSFFSNIRLISIIAESDKLTIAALSLARDEADLKKDEAKRLCDEVQEYVEIKKLEIENLKNSINDTENMLQKKQNLIAKAEKDEAALLAESAKIAKEIKRLQSAAAYYGGTMVWPTPGYTEMHPWNGFGMRMHPIYKYKRMHTGIDINAPFDSKIVAAADGKVIVCRTIYGYNSVKGNNTGGMGYGNYIIIDHGGGISTLYAHCKLLKVKLGDTVKAGQWIAVTGSTGTSTGAHLHFEVRENGNPVQPLQKKYLGVK